MGVLAEISKAGGVLVGVTSLHKEDVIDEILEYFCEQGSYTKNFKTKLKVAIMEREATGSTGIGGGGAIPHCRIGKEDGVQLFIAVTQKDVEFQSIDGKPVGVIFMVVLPKDAPEIHAQTLKSIAGLMRNERFFRYLKQAKSAAEVEEIIADYEAAEGLA